MTNWRPPKQKSTTAGSKRILIFSVLIFLCFTFLVVQLFRWQVVEHDKFTTLASSQSYRNIELQSKRGVIYSSEGVVLASDRPVWDIYISMSEQGTEQESFDKNKEETINLLSELLHRDIDSKDITNYQYQKVVEDISEQEKRLVVNRQQEELLKIEEKNMEIKEYNSKQTDPAKQKPLLKNEDALLFGIHFEKRQKRFYPNGTLASHILGFVGVDHNGKDYGAYGIEGYFWGDIKGKQGSIRKEENLAGSAIISEKYRSIISRGGRNIELTIDTGLQMKVEKMIKDGVKKYKAKSGTVIIMDPRTGAIKAMANYPDYNPNYYWQAKDMSVYKNRAVADVYEYGSVNKPLTMAMALEDNKITPDYVCNNSEKYLLIQEEKIYNFNKTVWGKLKPRDVLRHSVNICTSKIGLMVGEENMYNYLKQLGLGNHTNIGLQDEETSYLKSPDKWLKVDLATISFGQTISATPLQVISALSTIANDGERMQPYLVKRIYNEEESLRISPQSTGQIFSEQSTQEVTDMLSYAIGQQRQFRRFKGKYNIAGKTGTAQIARKDGPGYDDNKVNATFVGYADANDPTMIMLVRLEEPGTKPLASYTAVPLWVDIFDEVKDDLGVKRID